MSLIRTENADGPLFLIAEQSIPPHNTTMSLQLHVSVTLVSGDQYTLPLVSTVFSSTHIDHSPHRFPRSAIAAVDVPPGVRMLLDYVFADCCCLRRVTLPDTVECIGHHAFYGCAQLPTVVLPRNLKTLGSYAFSKCASLLRVEIPPLLDRISNGLFLLCASLESVDFPPTVRRIGVRVFSSCPSLCAVTMPSAASVSAQSLRSPPPHCAFYISPSRHVHDDWATFYGSDSSPPPHRLWAPDAVISMLDGPLSSYSTHASLPLKAAPRARTWASAVLYRDYCHAAFCEHLPPTHRNRVRTILHVAARLDVLPDDLWLLILTFVPMYHV